MEYNTLYIVIKNRRKDDKNEEKISCSIFLIALLLINIASTTSSAYHYDQYNNLKLSQKLKDILINLNKSELVPVYIRLEGIDKIERENEIVRRIGFSYDEEYLYHHINNGYLNDHDIDTYYGVNYDLYRNTLCEVALEMHAEKLNGFLSDYKYLLDRIIWKGKLFPIIALNLNSDEINQLSYDERIKSIHYLEKYESQQENLPKENVSQDYNSVSHKVIKVNITRDIYGLNGTNCKIGMIEEAMPDKNAVYFTSSNIIHQYANNSSYQVRIEHANRVAAIMVAKEHTYEDQTYIGITPAARLYATYYNNVYSINQLYECFEWLVIQGVSVINWSAGDSGASGQYTDLDSSLDEFIYNYGITVVNAAGNEPDIIQNVRNPGMAYNTITVGAIDDNGTLDQMQHQIYFESCWMHDQDLANKPDLVAPGKNITTGAGTWSGTSYAAPHITAVISQLYQQNNTLIGKPYLMKAILAAAITHRFRYTNDENNYNIFGAGVIDANAARTLVINNQYITNSFPANTPNGTMHEYYFNIPSASSISSIRISFAWEKPEDSQLADIDLYVYDPNGNMVDFSVDEHNNVEIVEFNPSISGDYKITAIQWKKTDKLTRYAAALHYRV